ncbi:hypothetical protein CJ419_20630 [Vibrio navarrensis]|nr:hypothetical protein [Vibrio navarrensis]
MDHFLPQADYPEWIIYSRNLVPACDCNSKRRNDEFLDFEDYPKFRFNSEGSASDFAEQFLTAQMLDNPFYVL